MALYHQMDHMDLVATNASQYIHLALKLLGNDDSFYRSQREEIDMAFSQRANRNRDVVIEWLGFLAKLFSD